MSEDPSPFERLRQSASRRRSQSGAGPTMSDASVDSLKTALGTCEHAIRRHADWIEAVGSRSVERLTSTQEGLEQSLAETRAALDGAHEELRRLAQGYRALLDAPDLEVLKRLTSSLSASARQLEGASQRMAQTPDRLGEVLPTVLERTLRGSRWTRGFIGALIGIAFLLGAGVGAWAMQGHRADRLSTSTTALQRYDQYVMSELHPHVKARRQKAIERLRTQIGLTDR